MLSIKTIENIFTNNIKSPIFTQLADLYFSNRQYEHALKVCNLGLAHDPDNQQGKYILSKINLINNNIEEAERLLQEICLASPLNLSAFLLLIPVMETLQRSNSSIAFYVNKIAEFYHEHHSVQTYYKHYCNTKLKKPIVNKKPSINKSKKQSFVIHRKLITKTMYKLFIKQKKYNDAFAILEAMKKNNKNIKFVNTEILKISKKIDNK